ncbi:hypothetical protein ACNQGO_09480 [Flavobacterium sp. ZT3P35]|uniref:hypothetical protein n=1 Tax=Flavobacterium sp. ZT3P35 TaxID=3401727 RepID=UPI003AAD3750
MEDLTKHIDPMMKPFRDIEKITKPMTDFQKSLEKPLKDFQKSIKNINKLIVSIPNFENPLLKQRDIFGQIGLRLKEYAEKTPAYLLLIAQNGWFIELDSELSLPSQIAYEIKKDSTENANKLLMEYYSLNLERIIENLVMRHPNRKEILNQILKSYKNGNHSVLIPCVLTQVDGICFDFTKKKFFIKEKNNKYLSQIASELEYSINSFLKLYLSPLQNQTPIMVREEDVSKFPCHLNRHRILHGTSTDYGTEINSLKVISLLKYISDLLTDLDRKTLKIAFNSQ